MEVGLTLNVKLFKFKIMAIDKKKYGKPIYNHLGYKIVPILVLNKKEITKNGRTRKVEQKGYSGEYAILAGKKEMIKSKDIDALKELINESKI